MVVIGASTATVQMQVALALSPQQVKEISQDVTVQIQGEDGTWGSGVIIKRTQQTYYVITSLHVINKLTNYTILTADRQTYKFSNSTVTANKKLDLAIVKFNSDRVYQTAKIGNSDLLLTGTPVYIAGFNNTYLGFQVLFRGGEVIANTNRSEKYSLIYTNNSLRGMSGGGIFNQDGKLVGIQGWGEANQFYHRFPTVITGNARGIAINTFLRLNLVELDVNIPVPKLRLKPKSDDLYLLGLDRQKQTDYQGAIAAYTQAIKINPRYSYAYYKRGDVYYEQGKYRNSLNDFNRAISLALNHVDVYNYRGLVRDKLDDKPGAIADYTKTILLDSSYYYAYDNRGNIYDKIQKYSQAIADYTQAIKINPSYTKAYISRGLASYEIGDLSNSINDLNRATYVYKNSALLHLALAVALYNYGKKTEAIAIGKKAIKMDDRVLKLDFLKQKKWKHKLLADTQKFLKIITLKTIIPENQKTANHQIDLSNYFYVTNYVYLHNLD